MGLAIAPSPSAQKLLPPWPPAVVPAATSLCEPQREFIVAHLRLKRSAMAINPSRETRLILRQAAEIGLQASRLCQLLFAIQGQVGQRKLWGIVGLVWR